MSKKAFTLIELLVVIAIVGILSGFVAIQMNGAISAANDAKVKANLDTIKKATILLGVAKGSYPIETGCTIGSCSTLDPVIREYIPTVTNGTYVYQSDGTTFTLSSVLSSGYSYQYDSSTRSYSTNTPINGSCGGSNGANLSSIPSSNLCAVGTATSVTGSGPWSWSCVGLNTGTTASCATSAIPVNGVCGTKNGKYASITPTTTQACTTGTITGMTGSYSWTCAGLNGGTSSGTCATVAATYAVQSFTTVGTTTWTAPSEVVSVEYLVVGGGGGGACVGGGGGGGGFLTSTLTVVPGNNYSILVGAGGAGAVPDVNGSNGGNSGIVGYVTANGGGGGGHYGNPTGASGSNGGSGGGGSLSESSGLPLGGLGNTPATTPAQGYNGGEGVIRYQVCSEYSSGGGGGAGGAGYKPTDCNGGAGGAGRSSSITGSPVVYGGGGGGAGYGSGGAGGAGGGGVGGNWSHSVLPGNGTNGLGGGGGGDRAYVVGGNGGNGVVILKYINNY